MSVESKGTPDSAGEGLWWGIFHAARWLRGEVAAGVTPAADLLPAGLGDAALAGLPPEAGLYACLYSPLVFWLRCDSRRCAVGRVRAGRPWPRP